MANVLKTEKQIAVISTSAEGSHIRSIERMTGINRNTIMNLSIKLGRAVQGCQTTSIGMPPKETRQRGRPPLPKGESKRKYVPVRLSDADVKAFTKAMKKSDHKTLSGWIRQTLRDAIENG